MSIEFETFTEPFFTSMPLPPRRSSLTAKLGVPRLRPKVVTRQRLIDRISYADVPLTVVSGPAGYGKSTLVSQWVNHSGIPAAWVQLDAGDNDPWNFFPLVAAAIQSLDRDLTLQTRELLNSSSSLEPDHVIIQSLMEDLSATTRAFALIFDDFQLIESPAIHEIVRTLLAQAPPMMRILVIGRTDPPLQLSRLRGRHEVLELGQEDLRFSNEEALELLQGTNDLEMTAGDVVSLNERAEGWVAGLQLVAYMLHAQSKDSIRQFVDEFCGSVRSIDGYLWEEVIARQPEGIQEFLLETSVLDRFTAPLCTAVTGAENAASAIHFLERTRLFLVPLDHQGHWYRYHQLFRDVLRDHLAQKMSETEIEQLHRRAAAWLEEHELIEPAARHAVAGRDWERAARLLERIGAELYEQDRMSMLRTWLQALPPAVMEDHPQLAYWYAFALSRLGRSPQATQAFRIVEQAWALRDDPDRAGAVRMLQALRAVNQDVPQAISHAREAVELLERHDSNDLGTALVILARALVRHGDIGEAERTYAKVRSTERAIARGWIRQSEMTGSGEVLAEQGNLPEAAVLFRRVIKDAGDRDLFQAQKAHAALGALSVEWDMFEDAMRHLRYADALAEQTSSLVNRARVCHSLARAYWAWGEFDGAFDEVEREMEFATEMGSLHAVRRARAQQARFWLAQKRTALAVRWSDSSDLDPFLPPSCERQDEVLTHVRLLIAEDQPALARSILLATDTLAEAQGRVADRIEIAVLEALTYRNEGEHTQAIEAFHRALTFGEPGGFVRRFLDEGPAVVPLLRHASTRGPYRDYAQRLLSAIEATPVAALPSPADSVDALSGREVEVLRLVSAGMPNRDIGQHLFITEKTVKKHLSNILGKLQAVNRTQAVDQARRMGWI